MANDEKAASVAFSMVLNSHKLVKMASRSQTFNRISGEKTLRLNSVVVVVVAVVVVVVVVVFVVVNVVVVVVDKIVISFSFLFFFYTQR